MRYESFDAHPFDPVYDSRSRILILGSFPSRASREQQFYYAHKNNRFWKVLSLIYEEEITDRRQFCLDHRIALWDVIGSCSIAGSSDASIKDVRVNDFIPLIRASAIKAVATTGSTASKLYQKYTDIDIRHIALPSTSSANAAFHLEDLVKAYRVIREVTDEED